MGKSLSDDMKYFCNDERCTGCMACLNVCPVEAIKVEKKNDGFEYPIRLKDKCIDCGKCYKVCQVIDDISNRECNEYKQRFYATKNEDSIRRISSSGGAFTALCQYIFDRKGIVCAASMDDAFYVHHVLAESMDDICTMRGTYYVQSDLSNCYEVIKKQIQSGKLILFVGTPCQVSGLMEYLKCFNVHMDRLIVVDVVCHGVGSPYVFSKFINYIKSRGEIKKYIFRDKRIGWSGYNVSAVIGNRDYRNTLWLQSYNKLFSHNIINRTSCEKCKFSKFERVGDITIGDYWGCKKHHKEFYDKLGVSLMIVNTEKGSKVFKDLAFKECIEIREEDCVQNSLMKPAKSSKYREPFFVELGNKGYLYCSKKYGEYNFIGAIKKITRQVYVKIMG